MIDIHNHLLPGIDDGAADMAAALRMAQLAVNDGITHLVCTPHIQPRVYDNNAETISGALEAFRMALADAGIELAVAAAAEVRFGLELMKGVVDDSIPWLGEWQGRRVLLLEFPHNEVPFGAEKLTQWMLDRDVLPMIAHPERNRGLLKDPDQLKPFLVQGCLVQLTAASLTGYFGRDSEQLAHQLLDEGHVTVIASDAHNEAYRPPALAAGAAAAEEVVGEQLAQALVRDNPWQLVQGHFAA